MKIDETKLVEVSDMLRAAMVKVTDACDGMVAMLRDLPSKENITDAMAAEWCAENLPEEKFYTGLRQDPVTGEEYLLYTKGGFLIIPNASSLCLDKSNAGNRWIIGTKQKVDKDKLPEELALAEWYKPVDGDGTIYLSSDGLMTIESNESQAWEHTTYGWRWRLEEEPEIPYEYQKNFEHAHEFRQAKDGDTGLSGGVVFNLAGEKTYKYPARPMFILRKKKRAESPVDLLREVLLEFYEKDGIAHAMYNRIKSCIAAYEKGGE